MTLLEYIKKREKKTERVDLLYLCVLYQLVAPMYINNSRLALETARVLSAQGSFMASPSICND